MNWDAVQGSWNELQGSLKTKWSRLTEDDLKRANGKLDELAGALGRRYGMGREEARRQLERFSDEVKERLEHRRLRSSSPTAD